MEMRSSDRFLDLDVNLMAVPGDRSRIATGRTRIHSVSVSDPDFVSLPFARGLSLNTMWLDAMDILDLDTLDILSLGD